MSSATMTMLGMYNYLPDIFDDLTFPTGIDKNIAVDEILLKCGEFEILYSNPAFLKQAITHWGKKHYRTFDKWVNALAIEFDPLYNYDRHEEYTDNKVSSGSSESGSASAGSRKSNNGTDAQSISATSTSTDGGSTNQRDVSAYDSATYEPREKETGTNSGTSSGNGIANNHSNETSNEIDQSSNKTNMQSNASEKVIHSAHLYGNIGVTTSTQMLEDYLRVERFNIYEQIADIFVDEFCILVY